MTPTPLNSTTDPATPPATDSNAPQPFAGAPDGAATSRSGPPIVLVVDDEPVSLKVVSALLTRELPDCRVVALEVVDALGVQGGQALLQEIHRLRPAVVLTDVYMPGIDGLTLVRELRGALPDLPVVVMTARGSESVAYEALKVGAASYVPKSRGGDELAATVRRVLAVRARAVRHGQVFRHLEELHRKLALPSRTELVGPIVVELQSDLRDLGVCPEEDLSRCGVALTEALVNAIVHGNLELSSDLVEQGSGVLDRHVRERQVQPPYCHRRVYVELHATRHEAACVIRDEGQGFDPESLPDPTSPEMLLRPHGRGLLLIRTFMDEVRFGLGGRQITLIKRASPLPPPSASAPPQA